MFLIFQFYWVVLLWRIKPNWLNLTFFHFFPLFFFHFSLPYVLSVKDEKEAKKKKERRVVDLNQFIDLNWFNELI